MSDPHIVGRRCHLNSRPDRKRLRRTSRDPERRSSCRRLRRAARGAPPLAAAATLRRDAGGAPFASLVNVATALDGSPLLLIRASRPIRATSTRTRALAAARRDRQGRPARPSAADRLGRVPAARAPTQRALRRFLARHPKAAVYADFADFSVLALEIARGSLNGGFGRSGDLPRAALMTDIADAGAWSRPRPTRRPHERRSRRSARALCTELAARPRAHGG